MANTAQAKKRAKQSEKRRLHNASLVSKMRTYLKKVLKAIQTGDKSLATESYKNATPVVDSMVTRGSLIRIKPRDIKAV